MAKIVLITGATSGIGEACAKIFAAQNYNLIITGRRSDRLEALAGDIMSSFKNRVYTLNFDVRDKLSVVNALNALPPEWKQVDVLVNNAGLCLGLDPINEGDTDDWDTMIDTNIKGLLYVSRTVSPWMVARKSGHIINIGSIAGKQTYANGNVYCATKHAVDSLNEAMRIDLLPHKIRVSAIHPGAVDTEFSVIRFKGDHDRARKVYEGYEALVAEDIADAIWYMVSRPPHVNVNDMLIMPLAQANAFYWNKDI